MAGPGFPEKFGPDCATSAHERSGLMHYPNDRDGRIGNPYLSEAGKKNANGQ